MVKVLEKELPHLVGELIRRMTEQEKLELAKELSWEELEEWKATAEVLRNKKLLKRIKRGLAEEKVGKLKSAHRVFKS